MGSCFPQVHEVTTLPGCQTRKETILLDCGRKFRLGTSFGSSRIYRLPHKGSNLQAFFSNFLSRSGVKQLAGTNIVVNVDASFQISHLFCSHQDRMMQVADDLHFFQRKIFDLNFEEHQRPFVLYLFYIDNHFEFTHYAQLVRNSRVLNSMHLCWYDSSSKEFAEHFARFQTSRFDRIQHIATVVYVDHIFGEQSEDLVEIVLEYIFGLRRHENMVPMLPSSALDEEITFLVNNGGFLKAQQIQI